MLSTKAVHECLRFMISIQRRVIRIHLIQVLEYNPVHLVKTVTVHGKQMVVQELTTFISEGGVSPFSPWGLD